MSTVLDFLKVTPESLTPAHTPPVSAKSDELLEFFSNYLLTREAPTPPNDIGIELLARLFAALVIALFFFLAMQ